MSVVSHIASLYTCLCEAGSLYPVAGVIAGLVRR